MLTTREQLAHDIYWIIDYAADTMAQHCRNYDLDNRADCCPLVNRNGCPFACLCNRVSGDRWREFLVDRINRTLAELDKEVNNDNS